MADRMTTVVIMSAMTLAVSFASAATEARKNIANDDRPLGWRGAGDGTFPGANPPTHWSYGGKGGGKINIRWRTKLPGWGHSQPVVVEPHTYGEPTRVFVTCDPHWLVCLDANSGKLLWKRSISPEEAIKAVGRKAKNGRSGKDWYTGETKKWRGYIGFSFATPVTDGRHVFISFGQGQVACYDLEGKRLWANHISRFDALAQARDMYEQRTVGGPYCNFVPSPRLADDVLVVQSIGGIRGFDKTTGKKLWCVAPYTWYYQCGTGIVLHLGKDKTPIFVTDGGWAIRATDGKVLSKHIGAGGSGSESGGASVVGRDDWVIIQSGNNSGHALNKIRLHLNGGKLTSELLWETPAESISGSPMLTKKWVISAALQVFDLETGQLLGQPDGRAAHGYGNLGSPSIAGDHIFVPRGNAQHIGVFTLETSPRRVATNPGKTDRRRTHSTPAAHAGRLYYRDPGSIVCIGSDLFDSTEPAPEALPSIRRENDPAALGKHLTADDPRIRHAAITRLASLGQGAAKQAGMLWKLAGSDPYREIRAAAIEALTATQPTEELLETCWKDAFEKRNKDRMYLCRRVLTAAGKDAATFLVSKLDDNENDAIELLTSMGPKAKESLPALQKLLAAKQDDWRKGNLALAICRIQPDPEQRVALALRTLQTTEYDRRSHPDLLEVIRAVPKPSPETIAALLKLQAGAELRARKTILTELVAMRAAIPKVTAVLCNMYDSPDAEQREMAMDCLSQLRGQADGVGKLVARALQDDEMRLRKVALRMLRELSDRDAMHSRDVLVEMLDDPPTGMQRRDVSRALLRFGPNAKPALPLLLKYAEDKPEGMLIWDVWDLLAAIGPEASEAAPSIRPYLKHGTRAYRERARKALDALAGKKATKEIPDCN